MPDPLITNPKLWSKSPPHRQQTTAVTVLQQSIIAVHGLDGHHHNTWTHTPPAKSQGRFRNLFRGKVEQPVDDNSLDETMWLRDLLPEKLPHARIMTFEYEARVLGNNSPFSIRDRARALALAIRDDREPHPESGDPVC